MNKVFIIGRLTRDPEHRTTPNGISVTTFSVAVTRRMKRDEADFLNVVAWRGLADTCAKYLIKGQQVAVAGELRTRSYDAKDGTKRYVTEIQADDVEFLAKPGAGGAGMGSAGGYERPAPAAQPAATESDIFASEMGETLMDDEQLPF